MSNRMTRGRDSIWFVLVGTAISLCSLIGCSSQDGESPAANPQSFEQSVLNLPQGASLGDVEASLGEPVSEVKVGSEVTFIYRLWQLHFKKGKLHQRVREARTGRTSPSGPKLDHKVIFRLKPGMSLRAVKKTLGPPEVYERIYESTHNEAAVILRYAYWELFFEAKRLVRRTQN